ncbi:MAG: thioredoxin-like domain-containing protein [Planctomycetota bacterium]
MTRRNAFRTAFALAGAAALGFAAWSAAPPPAQADDAATADAGFHQHLAGNVSRLGDDGQLHAVDASELADVEYLAIYYSAHWCGPCRAFTPDLVTFYNDFKADHPNFELVFISSDRDEDAMSGYVAGDAMPWLVLDYDLRKTSPLKQYAGRGIPCLVLLDQAGTVLSDSYVDGSYVGPRTVMAYIQDNVQPPAPATATTDAP